MENDRWLYSLAVSALASSVAGLLVPLYIVRLGGGAAQLGISAAVSSLVGAPGAVLAGQYADRTGNRRDVVLVALVASAFSLSVLPFLRTVPLVIAVNAVLAISVAAFGPVATMLMVDGAPESAWSARIARLNGIQSYGATLGFVVGTVWMLGVGTVLPTGSTQESLFVVAALFGLAGAVLAARWLPRRASLDLGPRRSDRVAALLARTSRSVREATFSFGRARFFWAFRSLSGRRPRAIVREFPRPLVVYFVAAFLFFTGFGAFWAPLPLYLTDAKFGTGAVFGIYLVNNVGSTALFGTAGEYSDRHDARLVQSGALGTRSGCFLAVGALGVLGPRFLAGGGLEPLVAVAALLAFVGGTWAFISVAGTAIVSRLAPARTRGGILGIYAALSAVGGALGSLLGGWLAGRGFDLAFLVSALFVASGATVVLAARRLSSTTADRGTSARSVD
ncbi:MAG: MFS transporter [Salinigranum sp.]